MKTALQELIEWADTSAMRDGDSKSIITKMKELLDKERKIIIHAYKTGYTESAYLDYYPDKHSNEYYDELIYGHYDEEIILDYYPDKH